MAWYKFWRTKIFFPQWFSKFDIIFYSSGFQEWSLWIISLRLKVKKLNLHPIINDKEGRKISKSVGNVIDPLQVIGGSPLYELINAIQTGNLSKQD